MGQEGMRRFGGDWTQQKLDMLRGYLKAYTTALKEQPFDLIYVDAFAGSGYRELRSGDPAGPPLFPELSEPEARRFLDGSPRVALRVWPPFTRYVFVEQHSGRFARLTKLKSDFPDQGPCMEFAREDCNRFLLEFCDRTDWKRARAVLFLDPFGMQVEWRTLEAVAATQAIDTWILFPLGVGVNRLLRSNGHIDRAWRKRLDSTFGSHRWYDAFYETRKTTDLFGTQVDDITKTANPQRIASYWLDRLRDIFAGVAENPRFLRNSTGTPIYLFCFAMGNPRPKAKQLALKIAEHILKEE